MTKAKPTPGPWTVTSKYVQRYNDEPGNTVYTVEAPDQPLSPSIPMAKGLKVSIANAIREADARLIAAAPDLLAALADIAKQWPDSSAAKTALAAIAKARVEAV